MCVLRVTVFEGSTQMSSVTVPIPVEVHRDGVAARRHAKALAAVELARVTSEVAVYEDLRVVRVDLRPDTSVGQHGVRVGVGIGMPRSPV